MELKSNWIVFVKAFLITCGALSSAMAIKFSTSFVVNELPAMWSAILPWTRPPYLYLIINGIIITIAASSRFLPVSISSERFVSVKSAPPSDFASIQDQSSLLVYESDDTILEVKAVMVNGVKHEIDRNEETFDAVAEAEFNGEDKFVISSSMYSTPRKVISPDVQSDFLLPVTEKPLVPSTNRRKNIRTNFKGGRIPRAKRSKRAESLENTWKMITQGRDPTNLKVNDKWEHNKPHLSRSQPGLELEYLPKCKTFNNLQQPLSLVPSTKISREPSRCDDELNYRVEEFIKKFNEEMRLQRQESLIKGRSLKLL